MVHPIGDPGICRVFRLGHRLLKDVPHAFGGAIALAAHGIVRYTGDVDVFVPMEAKPRALAALRTKMRIETVHAPDHYIARARAGDDIYMDVLFPAGDPELAGVEQPVFVDLCGVRNAPVFSAEILALCKFYSERPQDFADFARLVSEGIVLPETLLAVMRVTDPDAMDDLEQKVRLAVQPMRVRPRPRRR